jgi:hypothetical protein
VHGEDTRCDRSVFRYAIVNLQAENAPTFALRGSLRRFKARHRPAITDEAELGGLLICIDEYGGCSAKNRPLNITFGKSRPELVARHPGR